MNKLKFIITIFIACYYLSAGATESQIKQVVVYRQGAKITRTATVSLAAGNQEIILSDLTSTIDPNSLQVNIKGSAILLSASVRKNFLGYNTLPERTKQLKDSLEFISDKIDWLNTEQLINQGEEKLITDNQKIVNEKQKVTAADIAQVADFYRNRLTQIKKESYRNSIELRELKEIKSRIEKQLQDLQYRKGQKMGEVVLNISSGQPTKIQISFSYLTRNAGWNVLYDLRCRGVDDPIDLLYKANVYQNTGYDWNDIDLVISTGNPTVNNERPVLNPWYIDFQKVYIRGVSSMQKSARPEMSAQNLLTVAEEEADAAFYDLEEAPPVPYEVSQATNQMATEYEIGIKQDIPADGKEHIVPISNFELPARYSYHTVPKLVQHAYLIAKIGDYNQYNLLPGSTNIFFEGMYIGKTYLNPEVTSDSLVVSLGRDDRVSVERNRLKDFTSQKIVGSNKTEIKGYETILRNNKNKPVTIEVLDQVPISMNKEIEVKIEEQGGAEYKPDYGRLLWKVELAPGDTKKIRFVYSVKYPKDEQISGL
ncbi:MAG: DUF4139 domain-containing protein [Bacteroidales bacterium]|jgi:uncharacterized protein (TIGR02231 family)